MYEKLPSNLVALWTSLFVVLKTFGEIQDRLDPAKIIEYIDKLKPLAENLQKTVSEREPIYSLDKNSTEYILMQSATQALQGTMRFESARTGPHEILKAFQSLRPVHRAEEILYALSAQYEEVSQFFLHHSVREKRELLDSLSNSNSNKSNSAKDEKNASVGIINVEGEEKRGYSLYIPEYYSETKSWPLIVCLHGASGNGSDFLWSWIREARSFGFILVSPSSLDRTWSIHSPAIDANRLNQMLSDISSKWNIDTKHILLNGMSDGGTYAMLLSIVRQSPFTHYAPVASAMHVLMNRSGIVVAPVKDLLIYQVHGVKDWMFPVSKAREVALALEKAGAKNTYREISDLSHNYPRDENEKILKWFYPKAFE